jgi:hypothetical protein
MKAEISNELYEAARALGAQSDLLGPIGSWGDTREEIYIAFEHLDADPQLLGLLGSWGDGFDDEQFPE